MSYTHREWTISDRMMRGIHRYVHEGQPVGDFLRAVISNDLRGAVGHADDENVAALPAFCAYFHNHTPAECWGSKERYQAWLRKHKDEGSDEEGP